MTAGSKRFIVRTAVTLSAVCLCQLNRPSDAVAQSHRAATLRTSQPAAATPTIADGAYTTRQARRGAALADRCTACHGFDFEGDRAPTLIGREFTQRWDGHPLGDLVARIAATQPPLASGPDGVPLQPLTAADIADVLAFVLLSNGYPTGTHDLPADLDRLNAIRFAKPRR